MANRSEQTRERLLDVAEALFSTHGVAAVSLRQIRIGAGQRNEAAVQYHFGDKDGVIAALNDRHTPRMQSIQEGLLASAPRPLGLRSLVDALLRPQAEYVGRGPGERAWIRILAELLSDPRLSLDTIQDGTPDVATAVGTELHERLSATIGPDVAADRIWAVALFSIHLCADRARLLDAPGAARSTTGDAAFASNLIDMAVGALTAPVTATGSAAAE